MRVSALELVVSILLATVLNVALAWICAISYRTYTSFASDGLDHLDETAREWWSQNAPQHWRRQLGQVTRHPGFGFHTLMYTEYAQEDGRGTLGNVAHRCYAGLPFRSFYGESWVDRGLRSVTSVAETSVDLGWLGGRVPLKPLFLGTLANVFLYALAVLGLLLLFRHLRAVIRRRRGHCATCGYPLKSLSACPECGTNSVA